MASAAKGSRPGLRRAPTIHQLAYPLDRALDTSCWCSSASWQRFAAIHGWRYTMWDSTHISSLLHRIFNETQRSNATKPNATKGTDATRSKSKHRVSERRVGERSVGALNLIGKYAVLLVHGGLVADCTLLWSGATAAASHAPSAQLVRHLQGHHDHALVMLRVCY